MIGWAPPEVPPWSLVAVSSLLLLASLGALGAAGPGDLLVGESSIFCQPGEFDCESSGRLSRIDPDTGAFELLSAGPGTILDVAAAPNGAIAAVFQSDSGGTYLVYQDPSGALPSGGVLFTAIQSLALETYGDVLFGVTGTLGRSRVRYGHEGNQLFFSPGNASLVTVGPSGEIYVLEAAGLSATTQSVDPVSGARTLVDSPVFPHAVEASGDLLGFDLVTEDLVRVDLPGGAVSVVATLGFRGRIGVGRDGTIFVAVSESATDVGDGFIVRVDPVTGAPSTQLLDRGLGRLGGFAVVSCDEVGGACVVAEPQCSDPGTCDDGLFCTGVDVCNGTGLCERGPDACPLGGNCDEGSDSCLCTGGIPCGDGSACNGVETCSNPSGGTCQPGTPLCAAGQFCVEPGNCLDCLDAADCDDGLACNGAESCSSGTCQPGPPLCAAGLFCVEPGSCVDCLDASDCDDGLSCNGAESCSAGTCQPSTPLCAAGQFCAELGSCLDCLDASDCDDGLFCNGAESCAVGGSCAAGVAPCGPGQTCNEASDQCETTLVGDVDILRFRAPGSIDVGEAAQLTLKLRNRSQSLGVALVNVTGVQNGSTIFGESRSVVIAAGGRATQTFSESVTSVGSVVWTASVVDGDPDNDVAQDTTDVGL